MSASSSEDYLAIITQLMAEKDRLITEKDELVVSKDHLWREMHQIIQEKNERIEQLFARCTGNEHHLQSDWEAKELRPEVIRLERRNRDLEKALRDAVETDEDSGGNSMNTSSSSALAHQSSGEFTKMESFEHNHSEIIPTRGASIIGLDDQLQLRTPASMSASHHDTECIRVASHPPTSIKILPVIQSSSYIKHEYGKLTSLEPDLLDIILKSLDALAASDRFAIVSREKANSCVGRRLLAKNPSFWTNQQSGCFACKTCFNRRTPCMRSLSNYEWLLLPLPAEARDPSATWQDQAYYIHQGHGTNLRFPDVWRKSGC